MTLLARHGVVRSAIKKDLVQFALPGMVVFYLGLTASGTEGWPGLARTLAGLVGYREARPPSGWETLGLLMIVLGLAVMIVAMVTLRRSYSSTVLIRRDHQLITHGVYRWTRNPIYLGALMVCFGIASHAESAKGALVMVLLVPIVLNRIRLEEQLLKETFGEEYESYRRRTRRLVPFLL